jgi:SWI/SNF-related matrix-associated actin-dependent regulator 1 of chromatin subfamily A
VQVNIKATQKELEEKSDKLVLAVASILDNSDSELSDKLVKAIQDKQAEFNDPVLQELLKIFAHNYNEQTQKMIQDIEKVLKGESVWKSLDDGVSYFHLNDGGEYIEDFEDVEYLTKGGPVYIGPRGGKWADPAHTIPYQEEVHGVEIPKERYSDEEAKEIMFKMGESLFRMQVSNPSEKDDTGFNSADVGWWGRGVFGISNLRRILKKYKKQLINNFGDDYYKCGIHEQSKNPYLTIKPKYTNNGDLIFPTDGSRLASRKDFDDYVAIQKKYELRFNGDHWKLAEPKVDDFDFDSYKKDLEELGHIVDDIIGEKKSKEVKEKEKKELDVTETLRRIKNRQIDNAVVLKKVSPTTFAFIASYSPEFNDLFSNKKGLISGVFKVNKERNWARETSDINLVEEAIEKIKRHLPKHLLVIDEEALKEAQIARDQYVAELEKPIPEVQRKLAPEVRLYPYQNEAVRFLDTTNGNALIGDEMGLGKTLESLAWVAKEDKKTIIVCPKVVRRTWLQEGHKFFPNQFKTAELIAKDLRSGNVPDLKDKNLVSVNYESLHKFYPLLKEAGFDTIIIDESHRMKNPKAKTTKSLQKITELMKHKILLSGTAIKNKKEELFTQINVVAPGMFTHKDQVKFATIGGLWEQMKKFYIARAKATVLKDLPEKSTSIILNEMEGLPDYTGNVQIGDIAGIKAGVAIGKAPYTANFVKELLESSDSRILVFSDSVEAAKKIKEELGDIAILHHGQMADEKREQIKEEFQRKNSEGDYNSQYRVLVTTRQSMAVGATLTAADKVVFNDLPWNAADLRQAEDRCHRVGQKNNVNVYWMTADNNTFDSSVVALINRKYELSKKVNQGKKLTDEEIKWMEKPVNIEDIMKRIQGADVNLLKEKEEIIPIDEPDKKAPIAQEEQEEKEKEIKDQQRKENGLLPVNKNADNITILNNIRENSEKVKEAEIVLRGLTENTGYGTGEGVIDNFNTFYFKDKIAKFKDDYEKNTEEYIKQFSDTVKQYASSYKEILSTNDKLGEKLKKLLDQAKEYDNTFSINKLTPIALIDVYNAVKDLNIKQLTEKERTPLSVEEARRGALKGYIQLLNGYINVEKAKLEQAPVTPIKDSTSSTQEKSKSDVEEEPIKNEVKEIEDDIKDTQNRIDKLRDRQFKDYQSGNITRAKITTYNADISNYNDRLQELKQDLKNLLTKEEVLKEKPIIVRKPITEEIKEPALTISKDEPVKRGRGRPPKPKPEIELPKKPRGRPPKIVREPLIAKPEIAPEPVRVPIVRQPILSIPKEEPVKRGRGRPRKEPVMSEEPKRPRGRPRKEKPEVDVPKRPRGRPRKFEIPRAQVKLSTVQLVENQLSLVSAKNIELNKIGEDATHFIYKPNMPLDDDDARLTMNQIRGRGVNVVIIPGENSLVKIRKD